MEEEHMATYLIKKAALVKNSRVQIRLFIPLQIYQRYIDLSKNLFLARQRDHTLETQVRIGSEDMVIKIKIKNPYDPDEDTDWEVIQDFEKFGPICKIDRERTLTSVQVQPIFSPPSGKTRYL